MIVVIVLVALEKASKTYNPLLFQFLSVFLVVCMIGCLFWFSKFLLCLDFLVVCSHP